MEMLNGMIGTGSDREKFDDLVEQYANNVDNQEIDSDDDEVSDDDYVSTNIIYLCL